MVLLIEMILRTPTRCGLGGNATIGSYIGYDFEKPVLVEKVTGKIRMLGYIIQYSDDLKKWDNAVSGTTNGADGGTYITKNIEESVGEHRYWRLYVSGGQINGSWAAFVYSLQFHGTNVPITMNI